MDREKIVEFLFRCRCFIAQFMFEILGKVAILVV